MGATVSALRRVSGVGRRIRRFGMAVLYPGRCAGCGGWYPGQSVPTPVGGIQRLGLDLLCDSCRSAWRPIESPLCPVCGRCFAGADADDHLCGDCLIHARPFDAARAVGHYNGALRSVIHRFKYQDRVGFAKPLARAIVWIVTDAWPSEAFDAVVPIPLHSRRIRSRGYNQAELLARHVAVWMDIPLVPDALARIRVTPPQSGLGAADRIRNMAGAFGPGQWAGHADARILLVDDVYTTGATATAAAKALRAAGVKRIHVATVARTD